MIKSSLREDRGKRVLGRRNNMCQGHEEGEEEFPVQELRQLVRLERGRAEGWEKKPER